MELIIESLIFGGIAQIAGKTRTGREWPVDAIAVVDGLALVPALVGGMVGGLIVEIGTRYVTGGHHTHGAVSA